MDSSIHNLPGVFRELSRLSDGDHTIYLRTDSHNFLEIHRTGTRDLFTSTVAAFIPNVVIKLQTPFVPPIISAVPSQQGSPTLHTRSRLFIVESLSDIVNFVQHHKAAFIREDATLAVWADEVQPALAALHQVLEELGIALDRHDLVRVADPTSNPGECVADSNADRDAFDEFIHNYDDPIDKSHDESSFPKAGRNALLPLASLDDADTLEAMYTVSRTNLFDSLSSDSLVSGDSPFLSSAVTTDMSHLCLRDSALQTCLSPTFSSLSFDFSSPSVSSSGSSDRSALSTPLTIAPSVLSSPLSTWSSPQLATISECAMEELLQDTLLVDSAGLPTASPPSSGKELSVDTPSKRKRSPKAKPARPAEEAVPEKPRSRRSRRSPRVPTSPKPATTASPRARKPVSKVIAPAPPVSQRAVCPLPRRTGRTRSSSTSSTSSTCSSSCASRTCTPSASKAKRSRAPAAQLTISRVTRAACYESESEPEPEILESDDSGSEYGADPFELDDEDEDYDDYRPAKRTRSPPNTPRAASPASPVTPKPVRRKAISPKLASEKKKASKKKKSSCWSTGTSKKKAKKTPVDGPPPTCVWCGNEFTRESDVLRHAVHSCKKNPFGRTHWFCSLCEKVISRTDAVIRHQGSDDCKKRQRELRAQGVLADKVTKKKAGARAAKAAKAPLSPRRQPSRSVSL